MSYTCRRTSRTSRLPEAAVSHSATIRTTSLRARRERRDRRARRQRRPDRARAVPTPSCLREAMEATIITDFNYDDIVTPRRLRFTSFEQILSNVAQGGRGSPAPSRRWRESGIREHHRHELQAHQFRLSLDRSVLFRLSRTSSIRFSSETVTSGVWDAKFWWAPKRERRFPVTASSNGTSIRAMSRPLPSPLLRQQRRADDHGRAGVGVDPGRDQRL